MKKRLTKKLNLNKITVATLEDRKMDVIKGGTILFICTESCTVFDVCCPPTQEQAADPVQGQG